MAGDHHLGRDSQPGRGDRLLPAPPHSPAVVGSCVRADEGNLAQLGRNARLQVAVVVASLVAAIILFGIDSLAYKIMVSWLPALWGRL